MTGIQGNQTAQGSEAQAERDASQGRRGRWRGGCRGGRGRHGRRDRERRPDEEGRLADRLLHLLTSETCYKLTSETTEGPYYIDADKLRQDITEDREGIPLTLRLKVIDNETCKPDQKRGRRHLAL